VINHSACSSVSDLLDYINPDKDIKALDLQRKRRSKVSLVFFLCFCVSFSVESIIII